MAVVSMRDGEETMIIGLLLPIIIVIVIISTVRRSRGQAITGNEIRLFFQYLVLYALVMLTATGADGLLGQLFSRTSTLVIGTGAMARNVSFIVVGMPLLALMWLWTKRTFAEDRSSWAWNLYVSAVSLTSLLMVITGIADFINSWLRASRFDGNALAQIIVWGAVWAVHWRLDQATPEQNRSFHLLLGSLVGLVTSVIGLSTLLGGLLARIVESSSQIVVTSYSPIRSGLALTIAGVPAWSWYWLRNAYRRDRDETWSAYALLAGVAGGLVTAVVAASTVIYKVLVWFLGDPISDDPRRYFTNLPMAFAVALVGSLVWWYHQAVLAEGAQVRTEVRRVYEYLISGIAVISAGVGISILVVSALEAVTRTSEIMYSEPVNTLLLAITLLLIAVPIWWIFWSQITAAVKANPDVEHASATRRVYLFMLFGIGGVVALIALLTGVYTFFEAIFESRLGLPTLRRMRIPIGILVSTAAIAAYHWRVFRSDGVHRERATGPRFVLLVGPNDPELVRAIRHEFGARVELRKTVDGAWSPENVLAQLRSTQSPAVMVAAGREDLVALEQ